MKFFAIIALVSVAAAAQITPTWTRSFLGGGRPFLVNNSLVDKQGRLFLTGMDEDTLGKFYFLVWGFSASGEQLFTFKRDSLFEERGLLIKEADSNSIIVAGISEDGSGTYNSRVIKLTKSGELLWNRVYGNFFISDEPSCLVVDSTGNSFVGITQNEVSSTYSILMYAPSGDLKWVMGPESADGSVRLNSLILDRHQNLFGAVSKYFHKWPETPQESCSVFKLDRSGNKIWTRSYNFRFSDLESSSVSHELVLLHDTLFVAGTKGDTLIISSIDSSGFLVDSRKLGMKDSFILEEVLDVVPVLGNKLAVLYENRRIFAQTFLSMMVVDRNLSPLYNNDVLSSDFPLKGTAFPVSDSEFVVYSFGYKMEGRQFRKGSGAPLEMGRSIEFTAPTVPSNVRFTREALYSIGEVAGLKVYIQKYPSGIGLSNSRTREAKVFEKTAFFDLSGSVMQCILPSDGTVSVRVFDVRGRLMFSRTVALQKGSSRFNLGTVQTSKVGIVQVLFKGHSAIMRTLSVK